jgi:hypothetical protein
MTPLLDPRRHALAPAPRPAPAAAPVKVPPGGRGIANAGVVAAVLPSAEPRHLRDMARELEAEAARREVG